MFYELGLDATLLTITCSKSTIKHTNLINMFTVKPPGRCRYDGVSPVIFPKNLHYSDVVMMSLLLTLTHVTHKSSVSTVDFEHAFALWFSNFGTTSSICNAKCRAFSITCPFSKYFQILYSFAQIFKYLPFFNIFLPFF